MVVKLLNIEYKDAKAVASTRQIYASVDTPTISLSAKPVVGIPAIPGVS